MVSFLQIIDGFGKYSGKDGKRRRIWFHFWSLEQKSIEVERCFEMANS